MYHLILKILKLRYDRTQFLQMAENVMLAHEPGELAPAPAALGGMGGEGPLILFVSIKRWGLPLVVTFPAALSPVGFGSIRHRN